MMRLAGGDAVTYMYENAGAAVSQEVIDETRKEYGLDQPFLVQYAKWFTGMAAHPCDYYEITADLDVQ